MLSQLYNFFVGVETTDQTGTFALAKEAPDWMLQPLSRQSGDTEKCEETMNDTVALHQITLEGSAHLNEKKKHSWTKTNW